VEFEFVEVVYPVIDGVLLGITYSAHWQFRIVDNVVCCINKVTLY